MTKQKIGSKGGHMKTKKERGKTIKLTKGMKNKFHKILRKFV